ncbi:uncharacterized protein LOC133712878 isoform X2 [Rosa rugosa]|uniref:uncharacterized protein LOC133712878 isoform X2 n=1 Tax=Rosa rugosa TaxID=74645 RepID=UPI002B40EBF4|nr:uncharacterized protein LOC133712878 isoform X2 [Rosa rugosa]
MAAMVARVTLDHIARQSNDIRRLADFYIEEKGIQIAHRPVQFNPKGSKKIDQVFFFDPDGNALEVSDSTSTALQWSARNGNAN